MKAEAAQPHPARMASPAEFHPHEPHQNTTSIPEGITPPTYIHSP
jgi:hypothetical protein